tara:strand:+ start:477 stop:1484 length:1008 start_codon:yes stop_codon:yes gene_type:complete
MLNKRNKISGVTLIEMLIGIVVSSIIIGAMYTSYSIINNTYSRVTDVAGISKSGRDIVSMIMRDVRMAGFKYYYGYNAENEKKSGDDKIPRSDYLTFDSTEENSHAPIIIYKNQTGDKHKIGNAVPIAPGFTLTNTKINNVCCDQIHIVYGDFDAKANPDNDEQYYKRYKISYFARALTKDNDDFYGVFRSKKYWKQEMCQQPEDPDPGEGPDPGESPSCPSGEWVTDNCPGDDCYDGELVREYLSDMSFVALDKYGKIVNAIPENLDDIYKIRSVDITLTFRSATKTGFFKNIREGVQRQILSLGREPETFTSKQATFKRDSIFLTVHTRNLGG